MSKISGYQFLQENHTSLLDPVGTLQIVIGDYGKHFFENYKSITNLFNAILCFIFDVYILYSGVLRYLHFCTRSL